MRNALLVWLGVAWLFGAVLAEVLKNRLDSSSALPIATIQQVLLSIGVALALVQTVLPSSARALIAALAMRGWVQALVVVGLSTFDYCLAKTWWNLAQVRVKCEPPNLELTVDGEDRTEVCNKKAWLTRGAPVDATADRHHPYTYTVPDGCGEYTCTLDIKLRRKSPLICNVVPRPGEDGEYDLRIERAPELREPTAQTVRLVLKAQTGVCGAKITRLGRQMKPEDGDLLTIVRRLDEFPDAQENRSEFRLTFGRACNDEPRFDLYDAPGSPLMILPCMGYPRAALK